MTRWMTGIVAFCILAGVASAQKPIVAIKAAPERSVFKNSTWNKPIIIKSKTDAVKHFSKDALNTLETAVDFKKQFVLVFAWRGSGRASYRPWSPSTTAPSPCRTWWTTPWGRCWTRSEWSISCSSAGRAPGTEPRSGLMGGLVAVPVVHVHP